MNCLLLNGKTEPGGGGERFSVLKEAVVLDGKPVTLAARLAAPALSEACLQIGGHAAPQ